MSFRRYNYARKKAALIDIEQGFGLVIPEAYSKTEGGKWLGGDVKDWYFQVSYAFPEDIRDNTIGEATYGSKGLTMRRLYKILSDTCLDGVPFLDYYFQEVFPALKAEFADKWLKPFEILIISNVGVIFDTVEEALNKADLASIGYEFSQEIKEDIRVSLQTGRIPFDFSLEKSTIKRRKEAGIEEENPFYATGRLIDSVIVLCELGNKKWKLDVEASSHQWGWGVE